MAARAIRPLDCLQRVGLSCSVIKFHFSFSVLMFPVAVTHPRRRKDPEHQQAERESYYVLSGSLRLTVAGNEIELDAGEFIHIPGKTVHGFKGTSDAPTQILILQSPGDADEFFRACAREIKKIPEDLARMPEVGARYGIRMAPPSRNVPPRWGSAISDNSRVRCRRWKRDVSDSELDDRRFVRSTEFGALGFHALRHTHATQLLGQHIHPKIVSERLGHASVAITLDVYSHVIEGMQEDAAAKIDEALRVALERPA